MLAIGSKQKSAALRAGYSNVAIPALSIRLPLAAEGSRTDDGGVSDWMHNLAAPAWTRSPAPACHPASQIGRSHIFRTHGGYTNALQQTRASMNAGRSSEPA